MKLISSCLVLSFSVAACGKAGETKADVYHPPAVTIMRPYDRRLHPLAESLGKLEIEEALNLGETQRYQIATVCHDSSRSYESSRESNNPAPVRLLNILPPELLTLDLINKLHPTCDFTITRWNQNGSSWRDTLRNLAIEDNMKRSVIVEGKEQGSSAHNTFHFEDRANIEATFASSIEGKIQLLCHEVESQPRPFYHQIWLKEFEPTTFKLNKPFNSLAEVPIQNCRMMVLQDDVYVAASDLFVMIF